MPKSSKTSQVAAFGDFQTPPALAATICELLARRRIRPKSVLEPTCGSGALLVAAVKRFPTVMTGLGVELNPQHVADAEDSVDTEQLTNRIRILQSDFFTTDWHRLLDDLNDPLLVIGNPPWVTNSELGSIGSTNLPEKTNFQGRQGLDAITGKSNFDICEWMLIRIMELLENREATLAVLCKTAVARKVLRHAWKQGISFQNAEIRRIDAATHFGAAVDACLLVCTLSQPPGTTDCSVFDALMDDAPKQSVGYRDGRLIADVDAYKRSKHLHCCNSRQSDDCNSRQNAGSRPAETDERDVPEQTHVGLRWRSGIKHDCARVMELRKQGDEYGNGLGETVRLEDQLLYPMLKSSEVAASGKPRPTRYMLVTQLAVGDDTSQIQLAAPKTWTYLNRHVERLDRRASSIYRNRPKFSIFGVGEYSFAPWKVAISGFYKSLRFTAIGPVDGKPVVLDDTSYFLPCRSAHEARLIASLLNSETARDFYSAYVFWDAKRPITIELLRALDLKALADELGQGDAFERMQKRRQRGRKLMSGI